MTTRLRTVEQSLGRLNEPVEEQAIKIAALTLAAEAEPEA